MKISMTRDLLCLRLQVDIFNLFCCFLGCLFLICRWSFLWCCFLNGSLSSSSSEETINFSQSYKISCSVEFLEWLVLFIRIALVYEFVAPSSWKVKYQKKSLYELVKQGIKLSLSLFLSFTYLSYHGLKTSEPASLLLPCTKIQIKNCNLIIQRS